MMVPAKHLSVGLKLSHGVLYEGYVSFLGDCLDSPLVFGWKRTLVVRGLFPDKITYNLFYFYSIVIATLRLGCEAGCWGVKNSTYYFPYI
jgi:hypothetical protein